MAFHGIFTLEKDINSQLVVCKQFASLARHMSGQRWSAEDYTSTSLELRLTWLNVYASKQQQRIKSGDRLVYLQTIINSHLWRDIYVVRDWSAEDYTSNYIFSKHRAFPGPVSSENGRINDAAATGSSAAPFSHHTGDMERRRL